MEVSGGWEGGELVRLRDIPRSVGVSPSRGMVWDLGILECYDG